MKWSREQRMKFIDDQLNKVGRLNRIDLMIAFSISMPMASLDINAYIELAPGNCLYDKRRKLYRAPPGFEPIYPQNDAEMLASAVLAWWENHSSAEEEPYFVTKAKEINNTQSMGD